MSTANRLRPLLVALGCGLDGAGVVASHVRPGNRRALRPTRARSMARHHRQPDQCRLRAGRVCRVPSVDVDDPEGLASIDRLAQAMVEDGIPLSSARRLTDDEVRRALNGDTSVRGICSHAQIQPEDRTDPGAGYPWDVLLDSIRRHHPDTKTDTTPQTVWGEGDTGTEVERIQRIVGATVDGDWGPRRPRPSRHGRQHTASNLTACGGHSAKPHPRPPSPLTEDEMRIITDGTRTALVGPGYLATLDTTEAVDVTKALVGSPVVTGNARQYDVWVAAWARAATSRRRPSRRRLCRPRSVARSPA